MSIIKDPLHGISRPRPTASDADIVAFLASRPSSEWAVLTGAGMSTESGIPDYRGPNSPKRTPMTGQIFKASAEARSRYWARNWVGWPRIKEARPNAAHLALAGIDTAGIVTQNVDGLHTAAGSPSVIDLHGRLDRVVCLQCGELYPRELMQTWLTELNPGFLESLNITAHQLETAPDGDVMLEETSGFDYPACPACGGMLKPDVVFFGESVPTQRVEAAQSVTAAAAGLVVLGSSLAVLSGLRFVRQAAKASKPIVIVTDGPTRADELATHRSLGRVADVVEAWQRAAPQQSHGACR